MSSIDSGISLCFNFLKNVIAPMSWIPSRFFWTRIAVVLMAVVAAIFSIEPPGDIIEITIFSGPLAGVFPAVVQDSIGVEGPRAVLYSMFLGVSTLFVWLLLDLALPFPALLASLSVYVVCSMMSDDNNSDIEKSSQSKSA